MDYSEWHCKFHGRYQLDWVALKSRYGLCLCIQRDQRLSAFSDIALSVQFSKSVLELQLNILGMMGVRNIFKK